MLAAPHLKLSPAYYPFNRSRPYDVGLHQTINSKLLNNIKQVMKGKEVIVVVVDFSTPSPKNWTRHHVKRTLLNAKPQTSVHGGLTGRSIYKSLNFIH